MVAPEIRDVIRAMAKAPRPDILCLLADGALDAEQIVQRLSRENVERHLDALVRAGILCTDGRRYALSEGFDVISTPDRHDFQWHAADGTGFSFSMPPIGE